MRLIAITLDLGFKYCPHYAENQLLIDGLALQLDSFALVLRLFLTN